MRYRSSFATLAACAVFIAPIAFAAGSGGGGSSVPPSQSSYDPTVDYQKGADAYASDPEYLRRLGVEVRPPVHFKQVIEHMGKGVIHPVVYRPLFNRLQLVTCRTFETFAANTIPLFGQDEAYVTEFYGEAARELVLPAEQPEEKILDMLRRPDHYAEIVQGIRRHLREKHSYAVRLRELIEIVES